MKRPLFACFLLCLFNAAKSQGIISGRIVDSNGRPLSLVSVVLQRDSSFLSGTVSDETGNFYLPFEYRQGLMYSFQFSLVGYQTFTKQFIYPVTDFSKIILLQDGKLLGDILVTARKPLVVRKVDRYIINVENSFLANGHSGLEVLQKSPGIWVDHKGEIRIKGSQSVMVMINDVVQHMSEDELSEYLKTLKSEDISKIEIIHNPPAEFEAAGAGGIIHILLKKGKKEGFSGSANGQYRQQGKKPYVAAGASLDYKLKSLYLSGNYSVTKDIKSIIETSDIAYPDETLYAGYTSRIDKTLRQYYRFGLGYDLNRNQSVNIQNSGSYINFRQPFITDINYKHASEVLTGTACTNRVRSVNLNSTTINYLWKTDSIGSMLKLISDYTTTKKKENNNFYEAYSDTLQNSVYRNQVPNGFDLYSLQADYTKLLKNKMEIKGGVKYSSIKRDGEMDYEDYINNSWVANPGKSSHFIYNESLLMWYSSVERSVHNTSFKAGLRAEETFSHGNSLSTGRKFYKSYFGLFPSLYIMQVLNEQKGNVAYLNYSRRLKRPALSDLNPDRIQFNNNTAMTGNPELQPQYSHAMELGYKFLNDYSADVYVVTTKNVIALWANTGNNFIEYQSKNFSNSTEYGFACNAPFKIFRGWSGSNNFSIYHLSYNGYNYQVSQTSFSAKSVHTVVLKKIMNIDAVADYRSAYVYSNLEVPQTFYFDLGVSKNVWGKQGTLRLYVADVFNTMREKEITNLTNAHIEFYRKRPTRTISLSFTYNFSSGNKFDSRKIYQSNSDEKNRIGN